MKHNLRYSLFPVDNSPGRKLNQVHTRMRKELTHLFNKAGHPITTEGWGLLSCLWSDDKLTQLELGKLLEKDGPLISRQVDALEKLGYINRCISSHDRRRRDITLTEKGRNAREPLLKIVSQFLDELFMDLSDKDFDIFVSTLDKIIKQLNKGTD